MGNKFIYIPNYFTQNYSFCRMKLFVYEFGHCQFKQTNQNLTKVSKGFKPMNSVKKNLQSIQPFLPTLFNYQN